MTMRPFARLALAFLLPTVAAAQAAPAPAPAATTDTAFTPKRVSPVQFLLFGLMHSAEVRTSNGGISDSSASLKGFEVLLMPRNGGIGLTGRMIGEADGLTYTEGGILIGSRRFSIDAAYVMRTGYNPVTFLPFDSTYAFARGGFRSRGNLGNTGFTFGFRAGYYVGIPGKPANDPTLEGWDGETNLYWSWSKFPLTAMLGYRIERFNVWGVEQEVSALTMGAGLAFGRR